MPRLLMILSLAAILAPAAARANPEVPGARKHSPSHWSAEPCIQ